MSSLFSPKTKTDVRNSNSSKSLKSAEQGNGAGCGSVETRSTFSKMRKRRPPPITICLESGSLTLTTGSTMRTVYADGTPATPTSPGMSPYMSPAYGGMNKYLMSPGTTTSYVGTPQLGALHDGQFPHAFHGYQAPTNTMLPAELPASPFLQKTETELEVPHTPTRRSFPDKLNDSVLLDSPPDLTPSSYPEMPRLRGFAFGSSKKEEPSRNGKSLTTMDFNELIGILPELSSEEIKEYWVPTMETVVCKARETVDEAKFISEGAGLDIVGFLNDLTSKPTSSNETPQTAVSLLKSRIMPLVNANINRIKDGYETRLKMKDHEITGLLQLHDSQINALAAFIHAKVDPSSLEVGVPDQLVQDVAEILLQNLSSINHNYDYVKDRVGLIHIPAGEYMSQMTQFASLKERISELESTKTELEVKLQDCNFQKEHYKEIQRGYRIQTKRQDQKIREKEAEIMTLQEKITQLLNPDPVRMPFSPRQFEKDLPSPPSLKRTDEQPKKLKLQTSFEATLHGRRSAAAMSAPPRHVNQHSSRDHVRKLDVDGDEGEFLIYKPDTA